MKGLIILSNGFEETEALTTVDLLRRAKINIEIVSLDKDLLVEGSHNMKITCDKSYKEINLNDYNFLVIPGGKAVFTTLLNSPIVESMVKFFMERHLLVATICAAPMILGKYGYLESKDYICFPGCESDTFKGNLCNQEAVVVDNIITSKACGTVFRFSYEIIKYLINEEKAIEVINDVYYKLDK